MGNSRAFLEIDHQEAGYRPIHDRIHVFSCAHEAWMKEVGDMATIAEREMLRQWWNGNDTPPTTATPELVRVKGSYQLTCATKGASIGYKLLNQGEVPQKSKALQFTSVGDLFQR